MSTAKANHQLVTWGWILATLTLFFPPLFFLLAVIVAIICMAKNQVTHGVLMFLWASIASVLSVILWISMIGSGYFAVTANNLDNLESRKQEAKQRCVQLTGQIRQYGENGGQYPDPGRRFADLIAKGILTKAPVDPWGQEYRWQLVPTPDGIRQEPVAWSCGPNLIDENGAGDDIRSE